jgi:hypothetical protein
VKEKEHNLSVPYDCHAPVAKDSKTMEKSLIYSAVLATLLHGKHEGKLPR